jgi:hypothetical protein
MTSTRRLATMTPRTPGRTAGLDNRWTTRSPFTSQGKPAGNPPSPPNSRQPQQMSSPNWDQIPNGAVVATRPVAGTGCVVLSGDLDQLLSRLGIQRQGTGRQADRGLSAWESVPSWPAARPDLRNGISVSGRESPHFTLVNGPLMARRLDHVEGRPSAFQAGHIPSCNGSSECSALSLVAAVAVNSAQAV